MKTESIDVVVIDEPTTTSQPDLLAIANLNKEIVALKTLIAKLESHNDEFYLPLITEQVTKLTTKQQQVLTLELESIKVNWLKEVATKCPPPDQLDHLNLNIFLNGGKIEGIIKHTTNRTTSISLEPKPNKYLCYSDNTKTKLVGNIIHTNGMISCKIIKDNNELLTFTTFSNVYDYFALNLIPELNQANVIKHSSGKKFTVNLEALQLILEAGYELDILAKKPDGTEVRGYYTKFVA